MLLGPVAIPELVICKVAVNGWVSGVPRGRITVRVPDPPGALAYTIRVVNERVPVGWMVAPCGIAVRMRSTMRPFGNVNGDVSF